MILQQESGLVTTVARGTRIKHEYQGMQRPISLDFLSSALIVIKLLDPEIVYELMFPLLIQLHRLGSNRSNIVDAVLG